MVNTTYLHGNIAPNQIHTYQKVISSYHQWKRNSRLPVTQRRAMEPAFVKQVLVFLCGVSPVAPFHSLMRYSVESLRQCYGIVTGFIGETKPKKFKIILYDDGCHFAPFAKDSTRASYSTAATTVSKLEYYIDEIREQPT